MPDFEPIDTFVVNFPLDLASIATAVVVAGGTMIGLWAVNKIGFRLVRKLITRMTGAV